MTLKPRTKLVLKNIDWVFLLIVGVLLTFNLIVLKSASENVMESDPLFHFKKQLMWVVVSFVAMICVAFFDYKHFKKLSWFIYGGCVLLLVAVLFMPEIEDTHRWIGLGFMNLQPSEVAKIGVIVSLACFLISRQEKIRSFSTLLLSFLYMVVPILLILVAPDLGTSLVFIAILIAMLWIAGISKRALFIILLVIVLVIALIFGMLYVATDGFSHKITDADIPDYIPFRAYQINRLIIFMNPYMDPLNAGYHMIQSEVAIGSGGLTGKGYGQGTQVQGNFLPAHHTDFIFSVVGEELGFVGATTLLGLYLCLLLRAIWIAFKAKDLLGTLIVTGVVSMLAFHILVNVGMTIGIMPITGLPLPFLSYGGSSMLFNMIALGLVLNVNMHREEVPFFGGEQV